MHIVTLYFVEPAKCIRPPPPTCHFTESKLDQLFKNIVDHNGKYKVSFEEKHFFNISMKVFETLTTKSKNRKKACKIKNNYPINKKIPGAHLQIVSNNCKFLKKIQAPIYKNMRRQNYVYRRGTDRQKDGQTD